MKKFSPICRQFLSQRGIGTTQSSYSAVCSLDRLQMEVLETFFDFSYGSRCSYQTSRFKVQLFPRMGSETATDFARRRAFQCVEGSCLPECCTDETHEPDGIDLLPTGQLGIAKEDGNHLVVYDHINTFLERDALLENHNLEYCGTITLQPNVSMADFCEKLKMCKVVQDATDTNNIFLEGLGYCCLAQNWLHYYQPLQHQPRMHGPIVRVFSEDQAFPASLPKALDDLVLYVSTKS